MTGPRRVVVTGIGVVSASGLDEEALWSNLLEGRSSLGPLAAPELAELEVRIGGLVDLEALDLRQDRKQKRIGRSQRFALEVARQALRQARLIGEPPYAPQDTATLWGSAYGPCESIFSAVEQFGRGGAAALRPSTVPNGMGNAASAGVSIEFQLLGTNQTLVTACASSTNAIGQGFRMVRDGYADRVLCGGVDAFFNPFHYGAWRRLGVLSAIADPARAMRPFAADRAGTVLGEGAGALVLESVESAEERGARPRGEILGYGESSDGTHLTRPSVKGQAKAMRQALECAGIPAASIGYINAHGTGTDANDLCESQSIREVFGPAADVVPVGATKSYFGHTLGASGVIESIGCLLGLEVGVVPPNLNLDHPDPACPIRLVGDKPLELSGEFAMKNSFGFGGGNAVVIYRKSEPADEA